MRAIETTGKLKSTHHLLLDDTLPFPTSAKVRIIVLFNEEKEECSESLWLKAASVNPAFSNLSDPSEDVYSLNDGKPFNG